MDSGPVKGPVCGIENCRSRIYEEAEDGYLYCQNGHRKGELLRGKDEEDYTTAARTRTRAKKITEEEEDVSKYFKGQKAFDLYLKCLQLILRHQVWFLVQEKGLPTELETVVLDLWALRIARLGDKISSESQDYDSQSQALTTSDDDSDARGASTIKSVQRAKASKGTPTLLDSLTLCYLGILTLRLPITPGDIYTWITDGKMPYRRAIKHLPASMKARLPAYYHAVLDPNGILKFKRFYASTVNLQIELEQHHGILWPPLNCPLLLHRYLKDLALPLELYDATLRLGALLDYDFALHTEAKQKLGIRYLPEAQLMACLVVCVKLLYPFDSAPGAPSSASEPAATVLDWRAWAREIAVAKSNMRGGTMALTTEELLRLEEKNVFDMLPEQLDQYLDFYQDNFLDEKHMQPNGSNSEFRNALYELFPIAEASGTNRSLADELGHEEKLGVVRAVHGEMRPNRAVKEKERGVNTIRPGQTYTYYKTEKDLSEPARAFYIQAAKLAGLSLDMLVMAVFFTEKKSEKWKKRQKASEKARSINE